MDGQLDPSVLRVTPGARDDPSQRHFVASEDDQLTRVQDHPELRGGLGPVLQRRVDEVLGLVAGARQSLGHPEGVVGRLVAQVGVENLQNPFARALRAVGQAAPAPSRVGDSR